MRAFVALLLAAQSAPAPPAPAIHTVPVRANVYMLEGQGGNIGLSTGEDGALLIDDQFARMTDGIQAAVKSLTDKPLRFVINTHWHGDHTGGNENLRKAGAIVVAHDNVRRRMSSEQFLAAFNQRVPAAPAAALPVVTFSDSVTFHWNGEDLRIFHVQAAHTDGDAIVHFTRANVVHMGDVYFNGMYPFIDVSTGGTISGMVEAVDLVLQLVNPETKFIPGHGPLSGSAELRSYREMLSAVELRVRTLLEQGKSRDAVIAARPTADYDAKWGNGFIKADAWVGIVYDGLAQ
jgi:glyoxylase-like metal-dependent hydrolase (beta-lactamase superfamily II)